MKIKTGILTACLIFSALCSCSKRDEAVLRLGFLQSDLHHLPAFVALEKGYFTEQGLTVRVGGAFKAGPEEMSAFGAGELDFGYVGQAPATAAVLNGVADVQFIAQVNLEGSAIVTRREAALSSLKQLSGKTVAIPGHATMQDFLLRRALRSSGMKFEDIRLIVLKPPEMLQALEQKNIDAFIAWQPYPAQALATQPARVLLDSSDIWKDHPCCVLAARRTLCSAQPETIKKILAAHEKACAFISANSDEAVAIGMKYTSMELPVLAEALRHIQYTGSLDKTRSREFVDFLKSQSYIKSTANTDERFSAVFFQ